MREQVLQAKTFHSSLLTSVELPAAAAAAPLPTFMLQHEVLGFLMFMGVRLVSSRAALFMCDRAEVSLCSAGELEPFHWECE